MIDRQRRDGPNRAPTAIAALNAIVHADEGRCSLRVLARQKLQVDPVNSRQPLDEFGIVFGSQAPKLFEPVAVLRNILGVLPTLAQNDVDQAKSKSEIRTWVDNEVTVRQFRRSGPYRIDDEEFCAFAPSFHNEGPEMDVGVQDVCAPGDNQLRIRELFGLRTEPDALR